MFLMNCEEKNTRSYIQLKKSLKLERVGGQNSTPLNAWVLFSLVSGIRGQLAVENVARKSASFSSVRGANEGSR